MWVLILSRLQRTLNVIAHVEMTGGVWYPKGGIYSIARALERLALENGVSIKTNLAAEKIVIQNKQVHGVSCSDGQFFPAKTVISDLDVGYVYQQLLPAGTISHRQYKRIINSELSCSGFILILGVKNETPTLAHHNIFFSSDYQREFIEIFHEKTPPTDPTIYVAISSKTDPWHAPPGCENWFILVNVPSVNENTDWKSRASTYRQLILNRLSSFGLNLDHRIITELIITPLDLERMTGARLGALYGTSSNNRLAAFRRPNNQCSEVKGLFFCGGTTHPGGGVPMVMLSAKAVYNLVMGQEA